MRTMLSRLRFVPLLLAILLSPLTARADLQISVNFAPPELPVYEQPYCPGAGYLWVPGYWAYDPDYGEYYWVPGTWARPPRAGLLWTPGYWGWNGYAYIWYPGYWGTQVGFYGGINYGYGYPGSGFYGGYWRGPHYYYNRSVSRIDTRRIPYVYQRTVVNNITINRISFNGGDGVQYRPSEREREYGRLSRYAPTSSQLLHIQSARQDRQLFARENGGRPPIAATLRPGAFGPRDIMPSRDAWHGDDSRREDWQRQNERREQEQRWQQQQRERQQDLDRRRAEQQRQDQREQLQQQLLRRNDEEQRRAAQDRQNWVRQQQDAQRQQEQAREREWRQREDQLREQQRRQEDEQRRQMQDRQRAYEQQQRQMQEQREQQQREAAQQQERMRREMQQQQERQQRDMLQQQERQQREMQQRQQQGEQQGRREAPPWLRGLQRDDRDSHN